MFFTKDINVFWFFIMNKYIIHKIWVKFFENATASIEKDEAYKNYTDKDKLLALYFTLFEIMNLNRSYILFTLKENKQGLKNLKFLKQFRNIKRNWI